MYSMNEINKPNFNNEVLAHGNTWKLLKIETQEDAYNKNYNLPSYVCVYKGEYVGVYTL